MRIKYHSDDRRYKTKGCVEFSTHPFIVLKRPADIAGLFYFTLAAAIIIAVIVASISAVAIAAENYENKDDNPGAITETTIAAHLCFPPFEKQG